MSGTRSGQAAHYDGLLAEHYSWMFGDSRAGAVEAQAAWLSRAGVDAPGRCVDLGCGSGFQSEALLRCGATSVLAVDLSQPLLDELDAAVPDARLTTVCADLMDFPSHLSGPADTVVCMGDTLTHLDSKAAVQSLFDTVAAALAPGGMVLLSWRDLSNPPSGPDRFIPLRSTPDRIMTCVLDDAGERVRVTDVVHERNGDRWTMQASEYFKLKLSPDWVRQALGNVGLAPAFEATERGLTVLRANA